MSGNLIHGRINLGGWLFGKSSPLCTRRIISCNCEELLHVNMVPFCWCYFDNASMIVFGLSLLVNRVYLDHCNRPNQLR